MYLVVNITRPPKIVIVGDLSLEIGPNKSMDLEQVRRRSVIDDSKDLKDAIRRGKLQVRHSSKPPEQAEPVEQVVHVVQAPAIDMEQIRAVVKEEFRQEMKAQLASLQAPPELLASIQRLTDMMNKHDSKEATQSSAPKEQPKEVSKDDDISEEKLIAIHAKVAARNMKNIQGNISHTESKSEDDVAKKAAELNKLIG